MPRSASAPYPLGRPQARRLWLRAQRLDSRAPFGEGPEATRAAVEHLGYVQIDTIHVIERCHHHILHSRIPAYQRADLRRAQSVDRSVFEYWTHALAYVPTRDFRFFVGAMKRDWHRRSTWFGTVTLPYLRRVLGRIEREGALTIRDIDDEALVEKRGLWSSRKPSKRALEMAFYRGEVTISQRSGMLKTYELTRRHFGWERLPKAAPDKEVLGYLLDRALRSQGVVSLESVCHGDPARKPAMQRLIEARTRLGELVPVALEGAETWKHWAEPATLEHVPEPASELVHVLSPFDPLILQRRRLHAFFGYQHVFEAYLPKEKRQFGYFALPVLVGDAVLALLDLKTDRERRKLLVQKWTWLAKSGRRPLEGRIEEALHRFEEFQLGS